MGSRHPVCVRVRAVRRGEYRFHRQPGTLLDTGVITADIVNFEQKTLISNEATAETVTVCIGGGRAGWSSCW